MLGFYLLVALNGDEEMRKGKLFPLRSQPDASISHRKEQHPLLWKYEITGLFREQAEALGVRNRPRLLDQTRSWRRGPVAGSGM